MERIWAPWRLEYVANTDNKKDYCIFCDDTDETDEKRKILKRGEHCFAIMNIFPYNNGHTLIAPYRHVANLADLKKEEMCEIMESLGIWTEILKKALHCHGFNIGVNIGRIAGAGIAEHIHFHIVPRWDGDTNFMPVLADTKIIPQSLDDCFSLLKRTLEAQVDGSIKETP